MSNGGELHLIYTTLPNSEVAKKITEELIANDYAVCVNTIPMIESTYKWEGKLERSQELALFIKVLNSQLQKTLSKLKSLHPYEAPCIWSIELNNVDQDYLAWAKGSK